MTEESPYELVLTPPASRAIAERLPEAVATAVIDFLTAGLVANPHRLGKPLRDDLAGILVGPPRDLPGAVPHQRGDSRLER